ncbi:MAG: D-2-hydroxyacid dehydrogenase [Chloroflexi bacterium]|nr:D-2-hydroxyacid dehydrogenase [Chloroflexota bacterium]
MQPSTSIDVLITVPFEPALVSALQEVSPRLRVTVHTAKKAEDIPDDVWARCEVLYTTPHCLPAPEQAPKLKWIQFHYAGIDKALQSPILKQPGLVTTTLSGASASQMAEYVLTMLLALGHHLPALMESQRRAEWPQDRWKRFEPVELRDSTVGIAGYGSIGRQAARLLHGFGATVLATKRNAMQPADRDYTPEGLGDPGGDFVRRLYPAQAIRSMVRECDFVVVTVPLTPSTRGLINAAVLAAMKPSAYLVDVSRGGVVDHEALISALEEGRLAGAALDVFPEEPLSPGSPLWDLPNVIITPHISGNTPHYRQRAVQLFTENLRRYIGGQPLYNLFDPKRGY